MYWVMGEAMENREAVERVVQDHGRWVFCAARRRVRDVALAEDVAQGVFLMYWRKGAGVEAVRGAEGVEGQGKLAGWLYRAVRYCSANALRLQRIRQRHEREAAMEKKRSEGTAGWMEVEGELEGAVDGLSEMDRQAVVLRFYRGLSLSEVGKAMGINERAAQKRVDRAVGKLREKLAGKGVEVEAGSLGAMVLAHAVEGGMEGGAAGLVEKVMAGIGGGGGNGTAGLIAKGAEKMMVWAKVKVAAVMGTALLLTIQLIALGQVRAHGGEVQPPAFSMPKTEWVHIESKFARTEARKQEISGEAPDTCIMHFNPVTDAAIYESVYSDHRTVVFNSPAEGLRYFYDSKTGEVTVSKLSRTAQQLREQFELIYSSDWPKLQAMGVIKNIPDVKAVRSKEGNLDHYLVTIKNADDPDMQPDPTNIWVDPSTGRYQKLVSGYRGETRTNVFTYGEPSIRDVYDLNVPREAKVVPATGPISEDQKGK